MPLSAGDKLGHYEVLAPIGAGGMGEVYRGAIHNWRATPPSKFFPALSPATPTASPASIARRKSWLR